MYPYNPRFVPPRSSNELNQTNAPYQPVAPDPTRPTTYVTGFVEYNHNQTAFMNILNKPISWDPNQYGWNPHFNMGGYESSQGFGSSRSRPDFVLGTQPNEEPETQTKTPLNQTEQIVVA
ncbi:hypothetical protein Hanom_Chr12g01143631 [Helianthus anomalus]